MIFPESELTTYLGYFVPGNQVEPLLDRIAEASGEMEDLDLVSFLYLAQRELELTGDVNREDAAVVLIEEMQLPLADAAAILEENPATIASRIKAAWDHIPEDATGPITTAGVSSGLIMLDPSLELDDSLDIDPAIARIEPEAVEDPVSTVEPEPVIEPAPVVEPQPVESPVAVEFALPDEGTEAVSPDQATEAPAELVSAPAPAEVAPGSPAFLAPQSEEPKVAHPEVDEPEVLEPETVEPEVPEDPVLALVEEEQAAIQATEPGDAEAVSEVIPEAQDEEQTAEHEESKPLASDTPELESGDPTPAVIEEEVQYDFYAEAQADNPYLALTPESLEASSDEFPWQPEPNGHPRTAASLLALDDEDFGSAREELAHELETQSFLANHTPQVEEPEPVDEAEHLAAALMAAAARGDQLAIEHGVTAATRDVHELWPSQHDEGTHHDALIDMFGSQTDAGAPIPEGYVAPLEEWEHIPGGVDEQTASFAVIPVEPPVQPASQNFSHSPQPDSGDTALHEAPDFELLKEPNPEDTQQIPVAEVVAALGQTGTQEGNPEAVPPRSPLVEQFLSDLNVAWIAGGHDVLQAPASQVPLGGKFEIAQPPEPKAPRKHSGGAGADLTNDDAVTATYEEEEQPLNFPVSTAVWIPGMADRAFRSTPWRVIGQDHDPADMHGFAPTATPVTTPDQPMSAGAQFGDVAAFMADGPAPAPEWDNWDQGSWSHADYGPKRPKANRIGQLFGLLAIALAAGVVYLYFQWPPLKTALDAIQLPVHQLVIVGAIAGILGIGGLSMFIGSSIPKKPKTKLIRRRRKVQKVEPEFPEESLDSEDFEEEDFSEPTDDDSEAVVTDHWQEELQEGENPSKG